MDSDLSKFNKAHFIGIGGIGMSAVARMFLLNGKKVSGSDATESEITKELKKLGTKIKIGHKTENVPKNADLVIFSIAVGSDNPELVRAGELGIKTISYPQSLSVISKNKFTIAVSGTHGKTTTTAMIAKMMVDAELDPTVIVGSLMQTDKIRGQTSNFKRGLTSKFAERTNFIGGKSQFFVVEACEYRRSFLNINPKIAVITNIDDDHLDYYKDIKDIESAFAEFVERLPADGVVICDLQSEKIRRVISQTSKTVIDYSKIDGSFLKLKVPGEHNIQNAKVALAVAAALGISEELALKSLSEYSGAWRRFEYKGTMKIGALVYDDYGHHPTEIKATLTATRGLFPRNRIIAVFQPHLYSRTKLLLSKFPSAFAKADEIIVLPIYAAREPFDSSISSEILAEKIKAKNKSKFVRYIARMTGAVEYIKKNAKKGDVVMTIGAGDVFKIAEAILKLKVKS